MVTLEQPQPYAIVDHTADVGIRVHGATVAETLARLILAHAQLLGGDVPPRGDVTIEVELPPSPDLPLVAVDALREMGRLFYTRRLIARAVSVTRAGTDGVALSATCGPYDPTLHANGLDIKAVTYHAACFEAAGAGFVAQVILDV